jgi:hypothetical protein
MVMTIGVATPAVPVAGTVAVVFAALGGPALTTLVYGLPLIPVPLSVIATASVPSTVGV